MIRNLLFLLLVLCAAAAEARMYQWLDPDTETTQLSGKPPTWYRSADGGPRVLVFERGRMVDDTGVAVSETDRQRLRQEALIRAEQDQATIDEKLLEAKRMQAVMKRDEVQEEDLPPPEPVVVAAPEAAASPADAGPDQEAMRALVEKWEELRAAGARMVLDKD